MKSKPLVLRQKRKMRFRSRVHGTKIRPRLCVFRSNRGLSVQIIDDDLGRTLVSGRTQTTTKGRKSIQAHELGLSIAQKAKSLGIERIVFDRGGYLYHGRVAAIAAGAREGGLSF